MAAAGKPRHRGANLKDTDNFDEKKSKLEILKISVFELSWLFTRGYSSNSSLKLVGDRHSLNKRQRSAVVRSSCSDKSLELRKSKELSFSEVEGRDIIIDGFNLIITVEAALGGGVILKGRDGVFRDLSSVHGTYKSVVETIESINIVGRAVESLKPKSVSWVLDKPVSNSGRLRQLINEIADKNNWDFDYDIVYNPDKKIIQSGKVAISSDSIVIEESKNWFNMNSLILDRHIPDYWVVDLE